MKYAFTITQGRTGTLSLASLFAENDQEKKSEAILHEPLLHSEVGRAFPGMTPPVHYNTFPGFTPELREWWGVKYKSIQEIIEAVESKTDKPCNLYVETAHYLFHSGLVETITDSFLHHPQGPWELDPQRDEVHFILLHRPMLEVMASMHARGDYTDVASVWTWHLDRDYNYNLIQAELSDPIQWFYLEVEARKKLYEIWIKEYQEEHLPIYFHKFSSDSLSTRSDCRELLESIRGEEIERYCTLPEKANVGEGTEEVMASLRSQADQITNPFIDEEGNHRDTDEILESAVRHWLDSGEWPLHKGTTENTDGVKQRILLHNSEPEGNA